MIRLLRPDRNPLRRTADRGRGHCHRGAARGVPGGGSAGCPGRCRLGGSRRHPRGASPGTLAPGPRRRAGARPGAVPGVAGAPVRARLTAPGGAPREGEVYAPGGARADATVMVRTDGSGRLEPAPVQRADVTAQEALAAIRLLSLPRPPWRLPDSSPAGSWTGGGLPPGAPSGHEPARNGPAGCETWEHPARWPSLITAPHSWQTRHAQQAGSPPSAASTDPAGDCARVAARTGSAAGSLAPVRG